MPASLQHHRKTTGLFQHQQRRTEPPLQEVLLHLAQQPGDADKYRRAIGYLGLISIITHIGAVAAQPERPSAYTGGQALARQPTADEGAHGNATVDTAGPGVWAQRRMTGTRGLTGNGLSAPLVAKEASRYETTPSHRYDPPSARLWSRLPPKRSNTQRVTIVTSVNRMPTTGCDMPRTGRANRRQSLRRLWPAIVF